MKKILYLSLHDLKNSKDGVAKKINSQIKSFEKNSLLVDYVYRDEQAIYINCKENILETNKIKGRKGISSMYNKIQNLNFDYMYIRYEGTTFSKLKSLRKFKKQGKKIVIEIPTYPYKGEKNGIKQQIIYFYKEIYNFFLYKYVDYIVTFSADKEIFGIKCINISNGIDFNTTKLIEKKDHEALVFTSVSICAPWHGVDRFLYSLDCFLEQRKDSKIKFNIVGEGVETEKLKQIVSDSKYLANIVVFHGFKSGKELDDIYNQTDIGVGCLGNHRKGIYTIQALKNKEYAAKGIPMIFSEDDPGLRGKDYVYSATHDESLIDISDVIKWYSGLKITPREIRNSVKQFSWDVQMKKVIDKIEEE